MAGRRPVADDGGGPGFPRGLAGAHWNEQAKVNTMVAAPLRYGHRSVLGGEEQRQ
jgi:hypothetical protein